MGLRDHQSGAVRVYADTSVYGGCFDAEFESPSRSFFDQVREGRFQLFTSAIVEDELAPAPAEVRALFAELDPITTVLEVEEETLAVRDAYLAARIVSAKWAADALHVAIASVARCSIIVSWNFRHIVHADKVPLYNAVNAVQGLPPLRIHAPPEVISYGE